MNFAAKSINLDTLKTDCLVIGLYDDGTLSEAAQKLGDKNTESLKGLFEAKEIGGKAGEAIVIHQSESTIRKLLLLGLGSQRKMAPDTFRKIIQKAASSLIKSNKSNKKIHIALDDINVEGWGSLEKSRCCAEKFLLASYQFTRCKSDKPAKSISPTITYGCSKPATAKKGLATGEAIAKGMNVARELGNLPGNICTPKYLTSEAKKLGRKHKNLSVKALSEKQMADLGMNSLLSVSAGSKQEAQLIIMEYKGAAKSQKPHVLVGKGITFDTGGISLKPGAAMDEMKFDMCGAASVMGALTAITELQPKMNVVGIIAAAENMPGSQATKPGDIVTAMSGKTIEILNTDAEGRLVLCDALTYAERYKPSSVVDIATLTGACVIALGAHATGLMANNQDLADKLLAAGETTGDRAWQLPLWDDYKKQLKSNFADLANIGGRQAGTITAACFLSHFTEKYPWAHLDIAGTAWLSGGHKGATGRPVPLLMEYLLQHAK